MSGSPSRLNPILLATVALLVIAAVVFGISRMGGSGEDGEGTVVGRSKSSAKSSGRPASPRSGSQGSRHGGKSDGKTDEERKIGDGPLDRVRLVSLSARDELIELRARFATPYDDPADRKAFGVKLSQVKDPQARAALLRERTNAMRKARAEVEAGKTLEDRAREKELVVLMQMENIQRMTQALLENPELQSEAETMQQTFDDFLNGYDRMEPDAFHASFTALRTKLNALRRRNQGIVNPNVARPPVLREEVKQDR